MQTRSTRTVYIVISVLGGLVAILASKYSSHGPHRSLASLLPHKNERPISNAGFSLKQVQEEVARLNALEARQRNKFLAEGWSTAQADEPDPRVLALDPSALNDKEKEIQTQLQTGTFAGQLLDRVQEIALKAHDPKTRFVALESLGRSHDPRAQELLIDCFGKMPEQRAEILGLLEPKSLDDASARFLIDQINSKSLPDPLKQKALGGLMGQSLFQSPSAPPPEVLKKLDLKWRESFKQMYARATHGA